MKNAADPRRCRARQAARQGGAAEHHGGDRAEQVVGAGIDTGAHDDAAERPGRRRRRRSTRRRTPARRTCGRGCRPSTRPAGWRRRPGSAGRPVVERRMRRHQEHQRRTTNQNALLMPNTLSNTTSDSDVGHRSCCSAMPEPVLGGDAEEDQPGGQGDDQRVELEHGDQQTVDEADHDARRISTTTMAWGRRSFDP